MDKWEQAYQEALERVRDENDVNFIKLVHTRWSESYLAVDTKLGDLVLLIEAERAQEPLALQSERFYKAAKALHIARTQGHDAALQWRLAQS